MDVKVNYPHRSILFQKQKIILAYCTIPFVRNPSMQFDIFNALSLVSYSSGEEPETINLCKQSL